MMPIILSVMMGFAFILTGILAEADKTIKSFFVIRLSLIIMGVLFLRLAFNLGSELP